MLDFEATCEENDRSFISEVIEFPVVVVDGKTNTVSFEFHRYVKPEKNPKLTSFCTGLTGIQQV